MLQVSPLRIGYFYVKKCTKLINECSNLDLTLGPISPKKIIKISRYSLLIENLGSFTTHSFGSKVLRDYLEPNLFNSDPNSLHTISMVIERLW